MDTSRPISTVVPSLDGAVLTVLARTTQPLSGRRVHQLSRIGSETGVGRVLDRLSEAGLVEATEAGASTMYTLNRNHVAAPAVLQLTNLRQILIERLRETIGQWALAPLHASLFGSTARGDGDLASDVDILLVHEDFAEPPPGWLDQVSDLAEHVMAWTGNHAQMYELGVSELEEHFIAGEPIVQDWIRDAITLAGPDFRQFRNRAVHGSAR